MWLPLGSGNRGLGKVKQGTAGVFSLLFALFIFLINFYWSIVDLQRCVNFCCTAR